jgi:hypothetical protein
MFFTFLAKLEAQGLLGLDSEAKNLGTIMALYIQTISERKISSFNNKDPLKKAELDAIK